jgi:hypothetical protein
MQRFTGEGLFETDKDLWSVIYDIDDTKPIPHAFTIKSTFDSHKT